MEYVVAGFVAEAALGELLKSVKEAVNKKKKLKTILESMESTLNSIIPVVESIKELNKKLDCQDEDIGRLWKQIKEGQELISRCSKTKSCSGCFKQSNCTEELRDLDNSLKRFYSLVLPLKGTKLLIETREDVKEIKDKATLIDGKVEATYDEAKGTHQEAKDIKNKAKSIDKKVEATCNDVHDIKSRAEVIDEKVQFTSVEVKDMHQKVKEINDKATRIHENVELTRDDVKDIREELQCRKSHASFPLYLPPEPPVIIIGLDKPLRDLKTELRKDGFSVVVITAPGGYGKTTLAKKLCHEEDIKGKYKDNIFFVTVSKKPNLKVIVQNLFLRKGYPHVPEFQSDDDAVNHFEQLLKLTRPNPILLVLDDVWPESEFLIDKLMFQIPDYMILVTSTCVFPRFTSSTHKLQPLNDVHAEDLFTSSAVLPDQSSYIPEKRILNQIAKACKGNPLALTVVGRSLCGKPAVFWENTVMELSKGGSIVESNTTLRDCLQQSLEVLEDKVKVKECYMDLVSFPEGQWIPATALIDMWVELYGLDEDGVSSVSILHDLDALNLVNHEAGRKDASEFDGFYNDHYVMQHDLLRQHVNDQNNLEPVEQRKRLIIDVTSANKFPKWWREQRKQHISACLLSITTDETFSPNCSNMQASEVEVLILNIRSQNYMLPEFMKKMNKLKALIITNYGFVPAEISNFPSVCADLQLNLKRIRLEKVSIPSLLLSCLELQKLQKISLVMCNIGQAFSNSSSQISSSFSNLSEIIIDRCIDLKNLPDWFCDLCHLRKLSISSCWELSELPKEIGKLVNLEVLSLHFCIQLVELPKAIVNLSKLSILDISDCANISHLPKQIGGLHNLRKIFMKGCPISELSSSVVNLKRLEIVVCDEEAAILWKSFIQWLPNLSIKS